MCSIKSFSLKPTNYLDTSQYDILLICLHMIHVMWVSIQNFLYAFFLTIQLIIWCASPLSCNLSIKFESITFEKLMLFNPSLTPYQHVMDMLWKSCMPSKKLSHIIYINHVSIFIHNRESPLAHSNAQGAYSLNSFYLNEECVCPFGLLLLLIDSSLEYCINLMFFKSSSW